MTSVPQGFVKVHCMLEIELQCSHVGFYKTLSVTYNKESDIRDFTWV